MSFRLKRVYQSPERDDGFRVLVERLWPRGVTKEAAQLDLWLKDVAPSSELRRWYGHDPSRWLEFQARYHAELEEKHQLLEPLAKRAETDPVTLVFSSREERLNSATALLAYLQAYARPAEMQP